jgi:hypothetical protein
LKLLLTLALAAQVSQGKKVALVVGLDEFADEAWPSLRYATKDARDFRTSLEQDFDEVRAVAGVATKSRVLAALAELSGPGTSDFDTVVVYFSTHGTLAYDAGGELVRTLVLYDTTKKNPILTGLSYAELTSALDRIRARQKLVVLAACHSGAGKSKLDDRLASELSSLKSPFFTEPNLVVGEGQVILAASAFGETAREDNELENDIYTHFFLEALEEGFDLDEDGAVTALEAHHYARQETIAFTQGRQRPTLTAEIVGVDPIVLRGRRVRAGRPMIAGFSGAFVGARLEIDGQEKGVLPGAFVVERGTRRVRVFRPDSTTPMFDEEIDAAAGAVVVLDDEVREPAGLWEAHAGGGFAFVRGSVGETHLPGYYLVAAGARYGIHPWVRVGVSIAGTTLSQRVDLTSPDGASLRTDQDVTLVVGSAEAVASVYTQPFFDVSARVQLGWTIGRRHIEAETIRESDQLVSHPFAGVGVEGTVWPVEGWGVRADVLFDLMFVRIDGTLQPTIGDRYALSVVTRF